MRMQKRIMFAWDGHWGYWLGKNFWDLKFRKTAIEVNLGQEIVSYIEGREFSNSRLISSSCVFQNKKGQILFELVSNESHSTF